MTRKRLLDDEMCWAVRGDSSRLWWLSDFKFELWRCRAQLWVYWIRIILIVFWCFHFFCFWVAQLRQRGQRVKSTFRPSLLELRNFNRQVDVSWHLLSSHQVDLPLQYLLDKSFKFKLSRQPFRLHELLMQFDVRSELSVARKRFFHQACDLNSVLTKMENVGSGWMNSVMRA